MVKKNAWRIALGLALILTGCGKGQRKIHIPSLGSTDGIKLYNSNCASCHNPIGTSTKKNKTASQITAAISSVEQMNSLGSLTSAEIQAIATALVGTTPPPPNPTSLTATPNSAAAITLSWTSGGGSTVDYRISYQLGATAPANCATGTLISESAISGTSHQVTGLATNTQYSFRVCAINDKTTPEVSSGVTVSGTTLTTTAPPPNPTSLTATPNSISAITLSWTSGGGSTVDYRISYQLGATAPATCAAGTLISESAISGTSHQVTGLTTNTQYSFRVCAINDKTTPEVSSGVTVSGTTLQAPPPPNGVALYGSKCASCHNPLATSTKKNKTAAQITAAISTVAQMSSQPALTALTPAEIQAIATALVDTAPLPPPNPIALAAVPNSMSAITLSWTSGGGSTVDYRISYQLGATAPANCSTGTLIAESLISGTSHQVTGLSANTQYSFRVCAINNKTTPDISSGVAVSAKTLINTAPPPNPTSLTATPNSAAAITLSWTSGGGSTVDYRISYQLGATAPATCAVGTKISESAISGTSHQVTGLSTNTQYSFRVCAINGKTTPDVSSGVTVSGTTLTTTAPPPNPTSLTATPNSAAAITLSWTSGGGSTVDYRISYQLGATAPATCAVGTKISESAISGTSHQVTGLSTNTQYSFRVCAINGKTTPDVSSGVTVSARTLQAPPPPNGVALYGSKCASCHNPLATSTKKNKTAARITWAISNIPQMSSQPALTALTPAEIQAIATALVDTTPLPPPNPIALAAVPNSMSAITLSWTSGGGSTVDYRISYQLGATAPANCSTGTLISESLISGTSYQVTGLSANTQYSFRVCAINNKTTPDISSGVAVSAKTLINTAPPPNPTSLTATPNSAAAVTLSWTSGAGSTVDYRISYQLGATAPATCAVGTKISESAISGTSHQVTGLSTNTQYSFRVCAINGKTTPDVSSGVTVSAKTLINTAPPPNPISLTATPNSISAITLSWTSGGGSTVDYRISYQLGATAPAACAAGTKISETLISGTSHQVTGLTTNTQYSFRVCAINGKTTPDVSSGVTVSARTLQAPPPPNGVALYGSKCASCHGPLANSGKKNKTAAEITGAISNIPQMSSQPALTALTPAEIQAIATALIDTTPPPQGRPLSYVAPIGTRVYVVSTFTDLFLPEVAQRTAADTPILNLINSLLLDKTGALGGPCRKYETRCVGDLNENIAALMLPAPNTLRKGYMTRACEEILAKDRSVQNALSRAGITLTGAADAANLRRLFDHFYPGHNPSTVVINSLISLVSDSRTKGLGDLNAWRYTMVPLCVGSALELL